jgi:hypothetical protein
MLLSRRDRQWNKFAVQWQARSKKEKKDNTVEVG